MLFNIILISISLSIDALGIGISYRLKGIYITNVSKFVIGLVSGMTMYLSLLAGSLLMHYIPPDAGKLLGVVLLTIIGLVFLYNGIFGGSDATYDFDRSQKIDIGEAVVLGFALSVDSISAGIGAAAVGIVNVLIPILVGCMQMLFLYVGDVLIRKSKFIHRFHRSTCAIISGVLIIFIAIIRLIA